jgi:hypothetical protein
MPLTTTIFSSPDRDAGIKSGKPSWRGNHPPTLTRELIDWLKSGRARRKNANAPGICAIARSKRTHTPGACRPGQNHNNYNSYRRRQYP